MARSRRSRDVNDVVILHFSPAALCDPGYEMYL